MTDLMIGGLSSGLVLAAMAAMAVLDARRAVVDPRLVLALLAAAAVWRYLSLGGNSLWTPWTGMGARYRRCRAADCHRPIAWPTLAALSGRRHDAGGFRFPAWPHRSGMDDAARIGVLARLPGLDAAAARQAHPQRPRAARPGHDRRGGRGVPGASTSALPSPPANRHRMAYRPSPERRPRYRFPPCRISRPKRDRSLRRNWLRPAPRCPWQLLRGIWCSNNVTPFPCRLHSGACLPCRASRRRSKNARRGSPVGWRSCPMRRRSAWSGGAPLPVCSTGSRR